MPFYRAFNHSEKCCAINITEKPKNIPQNDYYSEATNGIQVDVNECKPINICKLYLARSYNVMLASLHEAHPKLQIIDIMDLAGCRIENNTGEDVVLGELRGR